MSDSLIVIVAFFGIFFGAAILLAIVVFGAQSRNEKSKREHEIALEQIELEKERVSKVTIMTLCIYCQGLMPNTAIYCPNCGAPRKT
jgi:formate/nitrite transporter FocA (FNT family)